MKNWLKPRKILRAFYSRKPVVFQGFWHGPPLGPLRESCLHSFIRMGYTFELFTYTTLSVPEGVVLKNAADIIPIDQIFYYENPQTGQKDLGPFSDLFRFKLLVERGGWWSDVDTICLSANIPTVERAWAQELPEINNNAIGSSQIAMGAGDPLAIELYSRCLELSKTKFPYRESLGPRLISSIIKEMGLPSNIYGSPETFYPIRWIEMFKLWIPQFREEVKMQTRRSLFLPIYQSFPQYIGLTLGKLPPSGSFLAEIFSPYLSRFEEAEYYSQDEIVEATKAFFRKNSSWAVQELRAVGGDSTLEKLGLTINTV